MSFSYDPSMSDDVSKVRFLIQDTIPIGYFFEDEELTFLISENTSIYGAAAEAALALYNRFVQASTVAEVDDIRLEYRDRAKYYGEVYDELKQKATTKNYTVAPIFIGGADRKKFVASSEGLPNKRLDDIDVFYDRPKESGW